MTKRQIHREGVREELNQSIFENCCLLKKYDLILLSLCLKKIKFRGTNLRNLANFIIFCWI